MFARAATPRVPGLRELFGDRPDDERFTAPFHRTLDSLYRRGARVTPEKLVGT